MNKNPDKIDARRLYVSDRIKNRNPGETTETVVAQIAAELFVSKATIWKDYQNGNANGASDKRY
jgi:hypothetical protein